jgi:hypothetical protein
MAMDGDTMLFLEALTEVATMVWHALPWVLGIFIIEQIIVRIYDEITK